MEPWKKTLYLSWGITFIHGAGLQMFVPFLPLFVKELGITDPKAQSLWSGLLFGVAFLFSAVLAPYWGTLSDKYGRKPLLLRTTLGISTVVLLMSFTTNIYQLLALRIVHGMCGAMVPALVALVSQGMPEEKTGQGLGTMQSSIIAGNIIGPFIGGVLSDLMGYRNVLLVVFLLTLIAGLTTLFFIHEPKRDRAKPRATVMDNVKHVLSSPHLRTVAIALFAIQFSLFIVQPILPLFIVALHGQNNSATLVGLVFSITGFSALLFTPYWGKVGDRKGHKKVLSQSLLFAGIVYLPQALVASVYQLLPLRAALGFFVAGIVPSTQAMIVKNTHDAQRGGVLGVTHSVTLCGQALGPLMGGLIGAWFGYRYAIALTSLLLIVVWHFFRNGILKRDTVPITAGSEDML